MAGPALMPIFTPVTPSFRLVSTFWSDSNLTTYTDSSVSFGPAVASKKIIVTVAGNSGSSERLMSSITVGGNALSEDFFSRNIGNSRNGHVAIYSATLPSLTSGNVVVTWTGSMLNTLIGTYMATNLKSNALFDSDGGSSSSMDLDIPQQGVAVGCLAYVTGPSSAVWTGLTEDDDRTTSEGEGISVASAGILVAQAGRIISASSGSNPSRYACASYG